MNKHVVNREAERGSAGAKILIIIVLFFLGLNAGINFVPVAYTGENLKQEMQTFVVQGSALARPGQNPISIVKNRIGEFIEKNDIPNDAFVEVKQGKGFIQARVFYIKEVNILPFGIYKYNYQFDYTAAPAGFITKDSAPTSN